MAYFFAGKHGFLVSTATDLPPRRDHGAFPSHVLSVRMDTLTMDQTPQP